MENQNEPIKQSQRDFTLPLFLTGITVAILCTVLCIALYLLSDSINDDFLPGLGLVDPTPTPQTCPSIDTTWHTRLEDGFTNNRLQWPLGKEADEYGDSNIRIENGRLLLDLTSADGVFFHPIPRTNHSLSDFYFTVRVQQLQGSQEDGFGLFLRADGATVHYFYLNKNGNIVLQEFDSDKKWGVPMYSQYSIPIESGDMNKLTVIHSRDQAIFCVNNKIAFTLDNIGYVFGSFGVAVSLPTGEQDASFAFDDFKLYAP